jgi:site-specific DNA recombinase
MRAVGYFREVTAAAPGLAEQNKDFLRFCERQGYEVAGTFVDAADANGHAPGFRQLVAFLRERESGFVIVVAPSVRSLGADLRDAATRYYQLESLGAQIAFLRGGDDPASELLRAWDEGANASRLSERVRSAMRRKAVRGEVLGRPPYGYKVGARRRLDLVPEEAVVVRYIFRLYLQEGLGIRLIARRLNEEGLKTRRGGNWSMVSIRDILRNRAYLGTYARFGVRVPGSHPALVSSDDFQRAQERLSARRTSYAPRVASQFLLSGLAHCGYCGNRLIGVSRRQAWKRRSGEQVSNSYRYYQCESRTNQSVCGYHTRRAAQLEADVRDALARALEQDRPDAQDDGARRDEIHREIERLQARLRALDRRLERLVEAAARGRTSKEAMHKQSLALAADRLATEDAIEAAERRLAEQSTASERRRARERAARELADRWDDLSFAERQAALRETIDRVVVRDDGVEVLLRA